MCNYTVCVHLYFDYYTQHSHFEIYLQSKKMVFLLVCLGSWLWLHKTWWINKGRDITTDLCVLFNVGGKVSPRYKGWTVTCGYCCSQLSEVDSCGKIGKESQDTPSLTCDTKLGDIGQDWSIYIYLFFPQEPYTLIFQTHCPGTLRLGQTGWHTTGICLSLCPNTVFGRVHTMLAFIYLFLEGFGVWNLGPCTCKSGLSAELSPQPQQTFLSSSILTCQV